MRLGLDDTDSLRGMCTTSLVPELLARVRGVDLLGWPRLVRLNPNVPWKTRGNGAVSLAFGEGAGEPFPVAEVAGRPIQAYPRGAPLPVDEDILDLACGLVEERAHFDEPRTNPGLVALADEAPFAFYRRAVRDLVPLAEARQAAADAGAAVRTWKNGRGLVGALAACGWSLEKAGDRTFEVLAYRDPRLLGSPRRIDERLVRALDERFPATFDNYDPENGVVRVAPHGPDPVLFGVRGDEPAELLAARRTLGPERPAAWVLFETNQGTDEHLLRVPLREALPGRSVAMEGIVAGVPRTRPGGHAFVEVEEPGGGERLILAAYEPTKGFRDVLRALRPGDRVVACGAVRAQPREVNLEKLRVVSLAEHWVKTANPRCACGKAMKSRGFGAGYGCVRCGTRAALSAATWMVEPRALVPGWYEVPVCARRHLAKPLKRARPLLLAA